MITLKKHIVVQNKLVNDRCSALKPNNQLIQL